MNELPNDIWSSWKRTITKSFVDLKNFYKHTEMLRRIKNVNERTTTMARTVMDKFNKSNISHLDSVAVASSLAVVDAELGTKL